VNGAILVMGLVVAVAAAVRSTWSPCGLSMLSQITPIAERGRGHRFGPTAAWFVVGAVLGGLTLGVAAAIAAAATHAVGLGATAALLLIVGAAFLTAALDSRVFAVAPPFVRRQVNEDWLANYRPWVYGGGFGWQIGVGVSTYVMTAAVFLMIAIGALSANPATAIAIGLAFGLVRGLAVLLGLPLRSLSSLHAFHRRFDSAAEPVRLAVIGVQFAVAIFAAELGAGILGALVVVAGAGALTARVVGRERPTTASSDRGRGEPVAPGIG
jgi:hypothetical protein